MMNIRAEITECGFSFHCGNDFTIEDNNSIVGPFGLFNKFL